MKREVKMGDENRVRDTGRDYSLCLCFCCGCFLDGDVLAFRCWACTVSCGLSVEVGGI